MNRTLPHLTLAMLTVCCASAWANEPRVMPAAHSPQRTALPDLVEAAASNDQTQTLTALVRLAGLTVVLEADGPFTVLAPTDEAFARLPAQTIEKLKAPQNRSMLRQILLYHVLPGAVTSDQFGPTQSPLTAAGVRVGITKRGTEVMAGGARVIAADLRVGNGVIHVIDRVLMPPTSDLQRIADARAMIGVAIRRGVPLFNHGNAAACAAVYEVAAHGLLALKSDHGAIRSVQMQARRTLDRLADPASHHNATDRAWMLRRMLDGADRTLAAAEPNSRRNAGMRMRDRNDAESDREAQTRMRLRALGLPVGEPSASAQR